MAMRWQCERRWRRRQPSCVPHNPTRPTRPHSPLQTGSVPEDELCQLVDEWRFGWFGLFREAELARLEEEDTFDASAFATQMQAAIAAATKDDAHVTATVAADSEGSSLRFHLTIRTAHRTAVTGDGGGGWGMTLGSDRVEVPLLLETSMVPTTSRA